MAKVPKISDAEWVVMQVIWDDHPILASDVIPQAGVVESVDRDEVRLSYQGRQYRLSYTGVRLVDGPQLGDPNSWIPSLWKPFARVLPSWFKAL